ncbi:hypothetical protein [Kitasatospora cineracea]|uniref:hypothetical protein n=1 Tax=Kitasatospora cineracea TaxID=88074 RepID=UPI0038128A84
MITVERRRSAAAAAVAVLALAAGALAAPGPANAAGTDTWIRYASIARCKSDTAHHPDVCFGLKDGRSLGLADTRLADDVRHQREGTSYDDERELPAPEGPANPVVEVWNNSDLTGFISTRSAADAEARGETIYSIAPHRDATGPAVDCFWIYTLFRAKDKGAVVSDPAHPDTAPSYPTTAY